MSSSPKPNLPPPPPPSSSSQPSYEKGFFDFHSISSQKKGYIIPQEFVWPSEDWANTSKEDNQLNEPLIDLGCIINNNTNNNNDDEAAIIATAAAEQVRMACSKHGIFQVMNHGIDETLMEAAVKEMDSIFKLPLSKKLCAVRKAGVVSGYSGAHADRYSSKLPWKETFTFMYNHQSKNKSHHQVVEYFHSVLGQDFQHTGKVYQKYCEAMMGLSLVIMELLAISLGVDRLHYRRFFEDGDSSIMRCNYYPPCNNPNLTFGTGPHTDPTSLTILNQDQVGGLQVFSDDKWLAIPPRPHALVVNIGDTFTALSNGRYKSCLHRALVNAKSERRSLAFFLCPTQDKTIKPPQSMLISTKSSRNYPDFTWSNFLDFTQNHYRPDGASTLQSFIKWHSPSNSSFKI